MRAVEGGRQVWASDLRPVLLAPDAGLTLTGFDIAFPDVAKSNAYGFDIGEDPFSHFQNSSCVSWASINPQDWDSGLSYVCDLPTGANDFDVEVNLSRVIEPSTYIGASIPKMLAEGQWHRLEGGDTLIERIGPLKRMFAFERVGSAVYLRRKTSVYDAGNQNIWTPGNSLYYPSGGWREGWTYGGSPNAWPAYQLDARGPGGAIDKKRDGSNACSLSDTSNYASTWLGTVVITPARCDI